MEFDGFQSHSIIGVLRQGAGVVTSNNTKVPVVKTSANKTSKKR